MRKLLFILPFMLACQPPKEPPKSFSHIAEFDSTGGRFSELIVSRNVTPDYDIDDFVRIGTAGDALRSIIETIYSTNKAKKKDNGLRDETSLHYLLATMTRQYLVRRISNNSVERTRFFTKDSTSVTRVTSRDTLDNNANKKGERIDVPFFIERRLKHPAHLIYGDTGSEQWFGGKTDHTFEVLSAFWDSVLVREPSSMSKREAMTREYPIHFLKKYRVFSMRDIADSVAVRLTAVDTTSSKKKFKLILSIADSILVLDKSDTRSVKVFSFNSISKQKVAK